jgi:hypothetical protein
MEFTSELPIIRFAVTTLACTVEHELEENWEVEAQLRTVTGNQWSELWIIASQIAELESPGVWCGGKVIDRTSDGHDVYESLYIDYAEPVHRFIRLWDEMGLVIPYGTVFVDHPGAFDNLEWLQTVPIVDAVRFGSAIIRLERFSDGLMGDAIECGAFAVLIQRLKDWQFIQSDDSERLTSSEFATWMRTYRDSCRWRAAKSGPPHEYTIRDWRPEADSDFEKSVGGIREFGYPQNFYSNTYIYFNLDGLKYWTMGEPSAETTVLNRDPIENRYES